ncbi:MAG: hypothetical protein CL670_04295 [Balneola sp.]|jgi:spermidine synthase|nr:hypothetical protein [Balneola sp.]MBE78351.1 hypothetical protein [Balneola sp.]HBX65437.1 hypothetical protein [Balneolaceae bacterium]|tara:strand:+ start:19007 stop:21436 length:2430 start_codon:yes stop_codon:yes gene_type:complete
MNNMIPELPKNPGLDSLRLTRTLISLALISFGMIIYEIVLMRIFAVILSYHYVFAILSLALLGLGMGGLLLKKGGVIWPSISTNKLILSTALAAGIITALILYLTQAASPSWSTPITYTVLFLPVLPFLFFGMTIASFFQQAPERSSLLYGFDIAGGALAALLTVSLLNSVPATTAAFIVVFVLAAASIILMTAESLKWSTSILWLSTLLFAAGGIWLAPQGILPIKNNQSKDINRLLYDASGNGRVIETRWSAFGQTTLVENDQLPDEKMIYVDGAAGTSMFSFQALLNDSTLRSDLTSNFGQFFPFYFLNENEKDSALIIGPGGGRDILVALFGGVSSITGVEVNPDLVQIVKDYEDFNGGLYTKLPNVEIVVVEGRSFIRNTSEKYDLLMLALPVTKSSRSIDGYALTENYLFTVEAFSDYLDRLTPEGRIIFVTHGNAELYRLLGLALKAFEKRGIPNQQAMNHLYSVSKHNMPALVVKKTPFEGKDMQERHAALHQLGYDQGDYFVPFQEQASYLLPVPNDSTSTIEWSMFDQNLYDLSDGTMTMENFAKKFPLNISPVYDDNPFFYNFDKTLPSPFRQLYGLLVLGLGVVVMVVSVKKSPDQVKIGFVKPFARHKKMKWFLLVFLLLGVGFMMLEIALFQKLSLYLGNPVSATSVLLFSLLLGVGVGSLSSAWITDRLSLAVIFSTIAVFFLSLTYNFFLDKFLASAASVPLQAGLLTGSIGFAMGFPFPLTLRMMNNHGLEKFTAAMWGANGLASVAGAVTAMIIGIEWGFTEVLIAGGGLYLFASLLFYYIPASGSPFRSK